MTSVLIPTSWQHLSRGLFGAAGVGPSTFPAWLKLTCPQAFDLTPPCVGDQDLCWCLLVSLSPVLISSFPSAILELSSRGCLHFLPTQRENDWLFFCL